MIQIHTVASDPSLSEGAAFLYKIATNRAASLQVHAMHMIGCNYLGFKRVAVFATNDLFGTISLSYEIDDKAHCDWNIVSTSTILVGTTDFSDVITTVKALDVQVFVLIFDDPVMASSLLEQGYYAGLFRVGTQIIGSEVVTTKAVWSAFTDQAIVSNVMRGFIGVRYSPAHSLKVTDAGKAFVKKFRSLNSIGGGKASDCYSDDTLVPFSLRNGGSQCHNLNFSSFLPDGSDIYPYAPHAYDAVYSAAYALQQVFEVNEARTIDIANLHSAFLSHSVINFEGATGNVMFSSGDPAYPYIYLGDREVGQSFLVMNFDESSMSNGGDGFAVVGKFTSTNKIGQGVEFCDLTIGIIDGVRCQAVKYNTLDNSQPLSYPPYSTKTFPEVLKIGGLMSVFDSDGKHNYEQAQCLAAFLMAIEEINNDTSLLPETTIVSGIIDGVDFRGTIKAATSLLNDYFGGSGVDMVVSTGNDLETKISSQLFSQNSIIQIHTVSQAVELSNGNLYSSRLQTTPLLSYQGNELNIDVMYNFIYKQG